MKKETDVRHAAECLHHHNQSPLSSSFTEKKQDVEGHGLNNTRCQQPMPSPLSQPPGPPRPSHVSLALPEACPSLQPLRQRVCVCVCVVW